jgi:hypothetical protein
MAAVLVLAGVAGSVARAQLSGTGAIAGTVQDPTGAVLTGATVTVVNVDTNVATTRTTTKAGDFNISALIPGTYTATVEAAGFEGYKQENITVNALETVGLNVKLTVGQATETVTITSAPPLLSTTDAVLGATMDNEMYSNLPIMMGAQGNADQRRATDFAFLMPGVQGNFTSNNATSNTGIVNGSGPSGGVQEVYIEGVDLPEADQVGDPRFTWTALGVDAINQFQMQTAGVSSQYAGQGVQNYAVKSGGNAIHGSLYEYFRNTMFDAWLFTNKVPTLNAQGVIQQNGIKPREVNNEFGIVISGPIIKNKLFLFGNYGQYRYQAGAKYAAMTIPVAAELGLTQAGQALGYADFTGYAAQPVVTGYHIYDPSTEAIGCNPCTRTQFQGMKNGVLTPDVIPGSRISGAAAYINKFWIPYEQLANQTTFTNNLNYGTPIGLANWYSTGRIDYNENTRNQVALIIAFGRQASTGPNSGSGLGPPFNASQSYHPVTTIDILKDTFTISSHLVNQFAVGYGRYQSVSVTPNDAPQYNAASIGLLGTPPGQASNGYPSLAISGGAEGLATQGGYAWNSKTNNTYTVTDNVQYEFGKHNLTIGGQEVYVQFNYFKSLGPTGPMSYTFSNTQTENFQSGTTLNGSSGSGIASYMIGAASAASVTNLFIPGLGSRWWDPSFWMQDDYRVNEKLTLNLGLRWDIFPSIQEAHNIFTFFNPNGANSITGNKGTLEFAGYGDPALYCNCKSPSPTFFGNVGPRAGMAYSVDPKTVIRASYTVNFARGDWTSGSQSGSPSTLGLTPSGSTPPVTTTGYPVIYWDATACSNGTNQGVNCGFNGSTANPVPPAGGTSLAEYGTGNTTAVPSSSGMTYFDKYKGARTPEFINWTVGLQREITRDMSLSVSYVGSEGHFVSGGWNPLNRRNALPSNFALLAGYNAGATTATPCSGVGTASSNCTVPLLTSKATAADIAEIQSLGFVAPNPVANGQTYLATNGATGYFNYYPQFGVSDTTNFNGNTNFHALEISLRQRAAHGVDLMLNYTYSKSMDDVGTFRTTDNPRLDRSLSVTNQPQNLTGTVVYLSPFGKGSMASENFLLRSLAKDWTVSGVVTYHSGAAEAFTGSGCPTTFGTCMPSAVAGVQARTLSYATPPGGKVAQTGYANTYTQIQHLNPAAFTVNNLSNSATSTNSQQINVGLGAAAYVPGTAARVGADGVYGMGFYDVDMSLKRSFPIYESWRLQFEADMSNVTNHVVWGSPNGTVGGSTYGEITGLNTFISPRDVQLSMRLNF